jgi:hypothetical protein
VLSHIGTHRVILTYRVILTSYVWHIRLCMFDGSLFVLFVLYLLVFVLSILLRCTGSSYHFGIFKHFLYNHQHICVCYIYIDCCNLLINPLWRFAFARFVRQVRFLNYGQIHTFHFVRVRMFKPIFNNI